VKRIKIQIDRQHAAALLQGKAIAFKIPAGAQVLQLQLAEGFPPTPHSFAKLLDVFFNGRPA
jgi:hypothetical protein